LQTAATIVNANLISDCYCRGVCGLIYAHGKRQDKKLLASQDLHDIIIPMI